MTAPDPRLDEIQARANNPFAADNTLAQVDADRGYLLAELRKAREALADAKAEALEEAAANIITNDPLDYWNGHLPEGLGFQEAMSRWLKAHAKAKRAAS